MEELIKNLDAEMIRYKTGIKKLLNNICTIKKKLRIKLFYPLPMAKFR